MKDFIKYTFATILGIFLSSLILFFFALAILGAIISAGDKPVEIRSSSVLRLEINQPIPDRSVTNPFQEFNPLTMRFGTRTGLNDILRNIEKAKTDDDILGIYIDLGMISPGFATAEEIRDALADFRTSGKFIIGYCDNYLPQPAYYLATISDRLYLSPTAFFEFFGLRSDVTFYKNALEKLGVEMQVIRHGRFKSFVEPFTTDRMSDESRQQIQAYLSAIWNHMLEGISARREIPVADLNRFADQILIRDPHSALDLRLVDGIRYYDEVLDELRDLTGLGKNRDVRFVSQSKYSKVPSRKTSRNVSKNKIAVIYASGDIGLPFQESRDGIDGRRFSAVLREARQDSSVKAIVLRVNSPGGSSLASDMIWREAELAARAKPLVASMGNVSASGGYYILAAADTILASPVTITGSIGVFGMIPNAGKLLNNKIGITFDVAKTNRHSDFLALHRPLTPEERRFLQESVERTYDEFVSVVSTGRDMPCEEVDRIAQGRVWIGSSALEKGLIDGFGGMKEAIRVAASMAGLEDYRVVELPREPDPYEQLIRDLTGDTRLRMIRRELGNEFRHFELLKQIGRMDPIQARMPYALDAF